MIRLIGAVGMIAVAVAPALGQPTPPPADMPAPTIAQTPEHLAAADELVVAQQVEKLQLSVIPQLIDLLMPMMLAGNEGRESTVRAILTEEMRGSFVARMPDLVRITRDAFARNFTTAELRDLTAFYRTPTGQRLIVLQPRIVAESMTQGHDVGRRAAIEAMPRIIERLKKAGLKVPSRT